MRILQLLSSASVTGPAEVCLDDAKALAAEGHEILFGCDTRREGNYAKAIRDAGFTLLGELTLCPKPTAAEMLRDVWCLRGRLNELDVVHCRFAHDHSVALMAMAGLSRRPALVRTAEIARSLRPGWMRARSFRACEAVVVSCRQYADRLVADHGLSPERVHVVPGRVDADRFCPGDGTALRAELGVEPGQVLFGIVSRIKEERRHGELVAGFARMAALHPEARLVIIGRGEFEPTVRERVRALGLEGRVVFAGYRSGDALPPAYRALDAKVWLAEGNDGTCRAVLEALATGKPVLAGAEGAMAEIVRDGEDGVVVPVTEEGIAAGLGRLCDPAVRAQMAAKARPRAQSFSLSRRAERLTEIYRSAAALRRGGAR